MVLTMQGELIRFLQPIWLKLQEIFVPATKGQMRVDLIAAYYSYLWGEALSADAFEYFMEKGLFSRKVANLFKDNVLARGGTEHPNELFKKFRGRAPDFNVILKGGYRKLGIW